MHEQLLLITVRCSLFASTRKIIPNVLQSLRRKSRYLFRGHSFCCKVDWVNYLTTHLVDDVASHLR
jgi:hypothetical protein